MKWFISALTLLASSAFAADPVFEVADSKKRLESSRNMFLEVKLAPYLPHIDRPFLSKPEAERPYYAVYGGGFMLAGELEVDFQFFQKFGSLAAGLSVGYAEKFGKALDETTLQRVDQSTGLRLVPIKVLLVYRFDWLKERFRVPLVPYAKGAFVTMPYFMLSGSEIETWGVKRGEGVKFGFAGVFGLALQLDFLDPRLARDFDSSVGVNHTYLFAEGTFQSMALFNTDPLDFDFSSEHFMFGLGFEF